MVSECSKLGQTEYQGRHDNMARYIHWQLCGKCGLERASNRNKQKPEEVAESENSKILWDFTVQCDRKIEARRPDIVIIDKEREVVIIDVAIPGDDRVKDKELEKVEKQHYWGQHKDTKKSTVAVRRLGPMVTYCNPLSRTINQAEYPA